VLASGGPADAHECSPKTILSMSLYASDSGLSPSPALDIGSLPCVWLLGCGIGQNGVAMPNSIGGPRPGISQSYPDTVLGDSQSVVQRRTYSLTSDSSEAMDPRILEEWSLKML
jgi:hypothetical protein